LAKQMLAVYKDPNRDQYLDNLFRLQIVAREYGEAQKTVATLREFRRPANPSRAAWVNVQYETYARAKQKHVDENISFEQAYQQAFRDVVGHLDGPASALVIRALGASQENFDRGLQGDLKHQKGKNTISLTDAVKLLRDYQVAEAYREFSPWTAALVAEDDARRYIKRWPVVCARWCGKPRRACFKG
ncbi:MAG TPA: hypothetical protein VGV15_03030, partial [Terriglobales bacterium]|nr:hypothetical protein [Terriglobales bacterium]